MKKTRIMPKGQWNWAMPVTFSHGWKTGHFIFVGGQVSADANGRAIGGDISTQTRNVFENIKRVLAEAGADMRDVVKHNVYYDFAGNADALGEFLEAINRVRLEYFSEPGPTTTETRVAGLAHQGLLVEIEAIATVGVEKKRLTPPGHWNWSTPLPFSHGWQVGDLIFVGAQASVDANGCLLGDGDIATQTRNVFTNLVAVLREAGADMTNLLRMNTYYQFEGEGRAVTDYWEKMTRVRMEFMPDPSTSGTALRVPGFPRARELIQVEGIASVAKNRQRLMPKDHWDWSIKGSPFSQGWKVGNIVFCGGQISADDMGRTVGAGDLVLQTRNTFGFIRNVLVEAGADMRDVVKLNTYYRFDGEGQALTDAWKQVTKVAMEYFPDPGPAAMAARVNGYGYEDLLIEIEAIAVVE